MNVLNQNQESLQQILPRVQKNYPEAIIKKPFVGLESIQIQSENVLYVIRKRRTDFVIDFDLEKSKSKVFGAFGELIARCIFKVRNKTKIEQFNSRIIDIVNHIEKD